MQKDKEIILNNGVRMPMVGFGTFKIDDAGAKTAALQAIEAGYRHIDTASYYQNEAGVGEAVRECGVPREELFVTSKVWMTDLGYDATRKAFEASMKRFKLDYLDMYLIHWPRPLANEAWQAMERLYDEGRIRAIGVCNYNIPLLDAFLQQARIKPVVNQIELHPRLQQKEVVRYCQERQIVVEAWSPIMKGQVMEIPLLLELGEKYGKSAAQVALRWHLQRNVVVLPKSQTPSRMAQNRDLFDFELTGDEMEAIALLDDNHRLGFTPEHIYAHGFTPGDKPK
ncbi:aldo/keto reductase [Anaerotalea alkaliphila]|uniref:Aldo/keto reductase n=1 Tax=Anaerotalea alkaliphila TaxID=2662126 RepID=A0A7X5HXB0_9FIRM|nr:aldo/keto reductase [Anaerotalea alkaliphila]NDL68325.1 aldo/keto reductase [Anaerotalea alkaliphila]